MPLKDYTTIVSVSRSITEITKALVMAGARGIAQEYDDDARVVGLEFVIPMPDGVGRYVLPVRASAVQQVLLEQRVDQKYRSIEHADRVAWRIMRDWILAQLAIIETQMVSLPQVMLPYMRTNDGATIFEHFQAQHALPPTSSTKDT
jgi:hypothetical protein